MALLIFLAWRFHTAQKLVVVATAPSLPSSRGDSSPGVVTDLQATIARLQAQVSSLQDSARGVDHTGEETIFVNLASYRDSECAPTLRDMFLKARAPWRVFVGVLQQNEEKDVHCAPPEWKECHKSTFCPSDQVRTRYINHTDAQGPTRGRYLANAMYRGEKYYFLMDSHNRFVTNWDDLIIKIYKSSPTKRAVLTHYPEALDLDVPEEEKLDGRDHTTMMCSGKFLDTGFIRFDGALTLRKSKLPRLQPYAAAGFLFADATLFREVPFDPYLPFLFDGEEILFTMRMWTHGWDIYAPSENIIYHYYLRPKAHKMWELGWQGHQAKSQQRVQFLLQSFHVNTTIPIVSLDRATKKCPVCLLEVERYGLGTVRTKEAFYAFAGADPVAHTVTSYCKTHGIKPGPKKNGRIIYYF